MVYKNFYINCIIRIILTGLTIFIFCFFLLHEANEQYIFTLIITALLIVYQLFALFRMMDRIIKEIIMLMDSIRSSDFSSNLTLPYNGQNFSRLNEAFRFVINRFKTIRDEREKQFRYLQNVIQHIGTGLIAFRQDKSIDLINNAASKFFKIVKAKGVNKIFLADEDAADKLLKIRHKEKQMVKFLRGGEFLQVIVYATDFYLGDTRYKLVSIQDIQQELEAKENESWEKLIHVLTHEIMNSITPISSLASTTKTLIETCVRNCYQVDSTSRETLRAIETIKKRSEGLHHFVENYRELTGIPKPELSVFDVKELFSRVENLMRGQLSARNIRFFCDLQYPESKITADMNLIEQILINLIKNSIDAVSNTTDPEIRMSSSIDEQSRQIIRVTDNGKGIREDVLEKIFVPFFTTKEKGTGIGLNISRQIMRMHGGALRVMSEPGQQTTFSLVF